jgi:hypothetical protein
VSQELKVLKNLTLHIIARENRELSKCRDTLWIAKWKIINSQQEAATLTAWCRVSKLGSVCRTWQERTNDNTHSQQLPAPGMQVGTKSFFKEALQYGTLDLPPVPWASPGRQQEPGVPVTADLRETQGTISLHRV